jgi:serine/threonine protein kinase
MRHRIFQSEYLFRSTSGSLTSKEIFHDTAEVLEQWISGSAGTFRARDPHAISRMRFEVFQQRIKRGPTPCYYRTDCWSFGVLLYEMLTSTPLFTGVNPLSVISAVLTQPVDLARLPASTPEPVRLALSRLLERSRDRRMSDLAEVATLLERAEAQRPPSSTHASATDSVAPAIPSIVVLPFTNRSSDVENEYFSDGLTEEIIADLLSSVY